MIKGKNVTILTQPITLDKDHQSGFHSIDGCRTVLIENNKQMVVVDSITIKDGGGVKIDGNAQLIII